MIKSDSIAKIAPALLKAQKTMGNAVKGAKNPFFKSAYADLNAVREACMPGLNENGITVLQTQLLVEGKSVVRTILLHESGEYIGSDTEILTAKQNDPQGYGSGISYARRYGLQSMVCLGSEDDDGEKAMGRSYSKPQPTTEPVKAEIKTTAPTDVPVKETAAPAKMEKPKFAKPKATKPEAAPESTEGGWE